MRVKVRVEADDGNRIVFSPVELTVSVNHSFGPEAQYKLRNPVLTTVMAVTGMRLVVDLPEDVTAGEVIAAVIGEHVLALEPVVAEAEQRGQEAIQREVDRITGNAVAGPATPAQDL